MGTSIKSIYGQSGGADVGYNPHKPGRPSHAYHACHLMAGLRLAGLRFVLGVEVCAGNQHTAFNTEM